MLILMSTARDGLDDRISGLDHGADSQQHISTAFPRKVD
jgi:hypothetical protein